MITGLLSVCVQLLYGWLLIELIDTVSRITWLRTKARYDRWQEEFKTVTKEIGWMVNWFEKQEDIWRGRVNKTSEEGKCGHQCYAEKQLVLRRSFKDQAIAAFGEKVR